ncbi:hypothetical protein ACWDE9_12280 [Streptomyces olivaceoviridis]
MRTPSHRPGGHQDGTRRTLRHAIGTTVAVSAAVVALVTPAAAADTSPHSPSSSSGGTAPADTTTTHAGATTAQERDRINAYWTPERMKLAGALVPEITPVPEDDNTPDDPRPLPSNTPDPGSVWTHGGAVVKNVGRLFFTFSDGYDGSCTARRSRRHHRDDRRSRRHRPDGHRHRHRDGRRSRRHRDDRRRRDDRHRPGRDRRRGRDAGRQRDAAASCRG